MASRFCTACGEPLEAGRAFCTSCGAAVESKLVAEEPARESTSEPAPPTADVPKKKRGKAVALPAAAVVLVIAVIAVAVLLPRPDDGGTWVSDQQALLGGLVSTLEEEVAAEEARETIGDDLGDEEAAQLSGPVFPYADASSVAASDVDSYEPHNAIDGDPTTCWAEGVEGSGIGEEVWFWADAPQTLSEVRILPGFCKSEELFNANSCPFIIWISVDSADSIQEVLSGSYNTWTTITLPRPVQTQSVRIMISAVTEGLEYDDCCISEVEFG